MKNLSLTPVVILIICFFSFSSVVSAGNNDSLSKVEIKGRVQIPQSDLSKSYKIELFSNNVMIDSATVVDDEPFLLRVEKNSFYSVRILKRGFLPMVVSINTRNIYSNKFNFDEDYFVSLYGFNLSLSLPTHPGLHEFYAQQ